MNLHSWAAGLSRIRTHLTDLAAGLREKGLKHFLRPLAFSFGVVFIVYVFAYRYSGGRLSGVRRELATARATAQYASRYRELQGRLQGLYARMPADRQVDSWLLSVVRDAMKEEGITFTSLSPVTRQEAGSYSLFSLAIGCRASYKQAASWIARLERHPSILYISQFSLKKDARDVGMNQIQITIGTVVPKRGAGE